MQLAQVQSMGALTRRFIQKGPAGPRPGGKAPAWPAGAVTLSARGRVACRKLDKRDVSSIQRLELTVSMQNSDEQLY